MRQLLFITAMAIYIYSDKIKSGKTTGLLTWAAQRRDVAGILAPDIERVRMAYDLETRRLFPLSVVEDECRGETWQLGPFVFSAAAFQQAQKILHRAFLRKPAWLVIDEIGFLELSGRGLEPETGRIIRRHNVSSRLGNLLLVVREDLLSPVLDKYEIHHWQRFSWQSLTVSRDQDDASAQTNNRRSPGRQNGK